MSQQTAVAIQKEAYRRAAVDEGDMRDTIRIEAPETPGKRTVTVGGITGGSAGKFVDYAPDVEYGGTGPAQPFMTPAAENNRATHERTAADAVRAAIRDARV